MGETISLDKTPTHSSEVLRDTEQDPVSLLTIFSVRILVKRHGRVEPCTDRTGPRDQ